MIDSHIKPEAPFTETQLSQIQQALARSLPESYVEFAREYGSPFVGGYIDGKLELPILKFLNADAIIVVLKMQTDLKSDGVLPVARCELGNLYVVDCNGAVYYINYYEGKAIAKKIAGSFGEMLSRIVVVDE